VRKIGPIGPKKEDLKMRKKAQKEWEYLLTNLQETKKCNTDDLEHNSIDNYIELLEEIGYTCSLKEHYSGTYIVLDFTHPTIQQVVENLVGTELIPGEIQDNISEVFENYHYHGETEVIVLESTDRGYDYVAYINHKDSPEIAIRQKNGQIKAAYIL